jgi:hypothetical protein
MQMSQQILQQAVSEHTSFVEAQKASLEMVLSRLQELRQGAALEPMLAPPAPPEASV